MFFEAAHALSTSASAATKRVRDSCATRLSRHLHLCLCHSTRRTPSSPSPTCPFQDCDRSTTSNGRQKRTGNAPKKVGARLRVSPNSERIFETTPRSLGNSNSLGAPKRTLATSSSLKAQTTGRGYEFQCRQPTYASHCGATAFGFAMNWWTGPERDCEEKTIWVENTHLATTGAACRGNFT